MLLLSAQTIFTLNGSYYVYHGVNVIPSFPPYYPVVDEFSDNFSFSPADVEFLKKHNLNMIVLQFMLPAVFPSANLSEYSRDYFARMGEVIKLCEESGIAVIVSLYNHYASEFNCGQGFPYWLLSKGPFTPGHEFPLPILETVTRNANDTVKQFDCQNLTPSDSYYDVEVFQQVYTNESYNGVLVEFWRLVLSELHGRYSNIIAYQLFTEPQQSIYQIDILNAQLLPNFYSKIMQPFVDHTPAVETAIILNTVNNDIFNGYKPKWGDLNLVLGYCNDEKTIAEDFELRMRYFKQNSAAYNYSSMVSSFGRSAPPIFISNVTSAIYNMSWAYFSLKGYGDNYMRCLTCSCDDTRLIALQLLSAPFFSKIAGTLLDQHFDYLAKTLQLSFKTGEANEYSILEIGWGWRLFGTTIQYFAGQEAVQVIIDDGKIKIKNVIADSRVDLAIY